MARPRGAARGSASAIFGMPELAEKRTVTGTSCLKCNALLTLAASALGTNLPSRTTPLAWADRCVVCLPNAELSASTNDSGVVVIAGSFCVRRPCVGAPAQSARDRCGKLTRKTFQNTESTGRCPAALTKTIGRQPLHATNKRYGSVARGQFVWKQLFGQRRLAPWVIVSERPLSLIC